MAGHNNHQYSSGGYYVFDYLVLCITYFIK